MMLQSADVSLRQGKDPYNSTEYSETPTFYQLKTRHNAFGFQKLQRRVAEGNNTITPLFLLLIHFVSRTHSFH